MIAAVRSDVGKIREINEDYTYVSESFPNDIVLAIVADGMGGHQAGEVASKKAVEVVLETLTPLLEEEHSIEELQEALKNSILEANFQVYKESIENDKYQGMGTTIVVAIISPNWVLLAHIGDSRAYLLDTDKIVQLTVDHSLVNELLKNGQISEEEADSHPQKNILTRALGTDQEVEMDITYREWEPNQTLLLCTDGLSNYISESTMLEVVQNSLSIDVAADHLLGMANDAGGNDNISIIIISNTQ